MTPPGCRAKRHGNISLGRACFADLRLHRRPHRKSSAKKAFLRRGSANPKKNGVNRLLFAKYGRKRYILIIRDTSGVKKHGTPKRQNLLLSAAACKNAAGLQAARLLPAAAEVLKMWNQIKKFAPLVAVAGYFVPYVNKGFDRVLIDLQTISYEKIMAKWQHVVIAIVAAAILYVIGRVKLPAPLKTFATILLYFLIGYNIAMVIDPPISTRGKNTATFSRPSVRNPYAGV